MRVSPPPPRRQVATGNLDAFFALHDADELDEVVGRDGHAVWRIRTLSSLHATKE